MRDRDLTQWVIISPTLIRDLVQVIDRAGLGLVFVTDSSGLLVAIATDGDIRRALLAGHGLGSPAYSAFNHNFLTIEEASYEGHVFEEADRRQLTAIPVVDGRGILVAVEVLQKRRVEIRRENVVVIMAGGKGLRLLPYTEHTPKPLLKINGKPMLQKIIENLRDDGFSLIYLAIHHLGEQIEEYFGGGSRFGVTIKYIREDSALGTAGALTLLPETSSLPVVVLNGDLLLGADIGKMVDYHVQQGADITVGAKVFETNVPYGVLSLDGQTITGIREKPVYRNLVNAGVYVLSQNVLSRIEAGKVIDMPEVLFSNIHGRKVLAYAMHETWADLGNPAEFARSQEFGSET
jgi:dTDP-glucose pyrophosphorylase